MPMTDIVGRRTFALATFRGRAGQLTPILGGVRAALSCPRFP